MMHKENELKILKCEKLRLQKLITSNDFKLYNEPQKIEVVKTFNRLSNKIVKLEGRK
jgi:hypothetical protein